LDLELYSFLDSFSAFGNQVPRAIKKTIQLIKIINFIVFQNSKIPGRAAQ